RAAVCAMDESGGAQLAYRGDHPRFHQDRRKAASRANGIRLLFAPFHAGRRPEAHGITLSLSPVSPRIRVIIAATLRCLQRKFSRANAISPGAIAVLPVGGLI